MSDSYDALLFDFDGVLADTERAHHAAWNAVLEPFGIQFTWEDYLKHCVGIADSIVAARLKLPEPEKIVLQKQGIFRETLEISPPFFAETVALIPDLARDYRMAVVSSSFRTEVLPPLERSGLFPHFETVICGNDAQNLKPAPDLYLLAIERLSTKRPLVIEDSEAGVAAGKAAGLEVLRISGPDKMPAELRAYLKKPS